MSLRRKREYKATQIFTNREEYKKSFWNNFEKYINNEQNIKALVFYGFGGIGKTALLNHLKISLEEKRVDYNNDFEIVNIDFSLSNNIDFIDFINSVKKL